MSVKNDGGQAFPIPINYSPDRGPIEGYPGMSLRDWFAGQTLMGIAAHTQRLTTSDAITAYAMADAMLAEQSK